MSLLSHQHRGRVCSQGSRAQCTLNGMEQKAAHSIFSAQNRFIPKYLHIAPLSSAFLQEVSPQRSLSGLSPAWSLSGLSPVQFLSLECSSSMSHCGLWLGCSREKGQWLEGAQGAVA